MESYSQSQTGKVIEGMVREGSFLKMTEKKVSEKWPRNLLGNMKGKKISDLVGFVK